GRPGRTRRARRLGLAHLAPAGGRGRAAEQVSADDSDGRYDEKPQHGQERHPDDGERQRVHLWLRPWTLVAGARVSSALAILAVLTILVEDQRGPAQRDLGPVGERHPPDRLAVDEGA